MGAFIAGYESIEKDLIGIILVWTNNFSQSAQNIYIGILNKEKKLTPFDVNVYFAGLGLIATIVYNFGITNDYEQLQEYWMKPDGELFAKMVLFSGLMGIIITLSILVLISIGGPLMVNTVGILKDVALTYAGFIFFDDQKVTPMVITGLGISFAAATFSLVTKYQESMQ